MEINFSFVMPVMISFIICAILVPIVIPVLRKLKFSNTEREELETHQKKAGTPSMGGLAILVAVVLTSILYMKDYPRIVPVVFMMVGFGLIGFLDDYLKAVLHSSDGLKAWQKLILQFIVTTVFAYYMTHVLSVPLTLKVPFMPGTELDLGWVAVPLMYFAVLGTVNGVNFTDGLDGLNTSVTIMVATFFGVVAIFTKSGIEPVTCAVVGALMAFLLFNVYPAKVFMGDTGSLALGGFVAATAYMLQMPLFILIVGLVYLVEVLSVILQVGYFKMTHGKRIFRMAPIHHHFELGGFTGHGEGWSETRVVAVFSVVTALLCLVGFLAL